MTRKDYIKLADVIVDSMLEANNQSFFDGVDTVQEKLLNCLEQDNPRFDREKFHNYINKQLRKG